MLKHDLLEKFMNAGVVCTDTRQIQPGSIFFALKGGNFNGNNFARQALESGCSWAVVDEEHAVQNERCLLVDDVLKTLQELATAYRRTCQATFIGITGSNGKTTTKELLRDSLSRNFKTQATKGNLNNHIGVPLTLLSIDKDTEIAIIEMGANHQKEIAALCEIAEPDCGLITNIGLAHLEGFGGPEGVKKGKGELFDYLRSVNGKVWINQDLDHLEDMAAGMDTVLYRSEGGPFEFKITQENPTLSFSWANQKRHHVATHLSGAVNMHNIAAAVAVATSFNVLEDNISLAINEYVPDNNRSQIQETEKNTLILDAYNANPSSLSFALENLGDMKAEKRFFIIGDMLELGAYAEDEHRRILQEAAALGIRGIAVGEHFKALENEFDTIDFCLNNDEAKLILDELKLTGFTILIKGSRGIRLEELAKIL